MKIVESQLKLLQLIVNADTHSETHLMHIQTCNVFHYGLMRPREFHPLLLLFRRLISVNTAAVPFVI